MPKRFSFFFHYNKPASQKAGLPKISLHFGRTCYIVDNVDIKCPTVGRIRKTQPRFVVAGRASVIQIPEGGNVAYIR